MRETSSWTKTVSVHSIVLSFPKAMSLIAGCNGCRSMCRKKGTAPVIKIVPRRSWVEYGNQIQHHQPDSSAPIPTLLHACVPSYLGMWVHICVVYVYVFLAYMCYCCYYLRICARTQPRDWAPTCLHNLRLHTAAYDHVRRNPKSYPHPRLQDFLKWKKTQKNTG